MEWTDWLPLVVPCTLYTLMFLAAAFSLRGGWQDHLRRLEEMDAEHKRNMAMIEALRRKLNPQPLDDLIDLIRECEKDG